MSILQNQRLKLGQLFTIYNHTWQVRKCTSWPCGNCELYPYWISLPVKRDNNPCSELCMYGKNIIPSECVAIFVK